jgi:hypothetical protein
MNDMINTPVEVAKDIVMHFARNYPVKGTVLDPFAGGRAFLGLFATYLDGNACVFEWAEISMGRDFFARDTRADWIISNPPYSKFTAVLERSLEIADNIVYLIPVNKITSSEGRVRRIFEWGGIPEIRIYRAKTCGFRFGFALGAVYLKRGYRGDTKWSFGI